MRVDGGENEAGVYWRWVDWDEGGCISESFVGGGVPAEVKLLPLEDGTESLPLEDGSVDSTGDCCCGR